MDAQVANLLLANGDAGQGRLRTPYEKAVGFYGDARDGIGHDLRTLAVAAQGDRADEKTVESLTDSFAEYQELVGRSLENDDRTGGKTSALADYQRATDLLQRQLLPEARDLVNSNNTVFNSEYTAAGSALSAQLVAVVALGVLLLAVLGLLQLGRHRTAALGARRPPCRSRTHRPRTAATLRRVPVRCARA